MLKKYINLFFLILLPLNTVVIAQVGASNLLIEAPDFTLTDVEFDFSLKVIDENGEIDRSASGEMSLQGFVVEDENGKFIKPVIFEIINGEISIENAVFEESGDNSIEVWFNGLSASKSVTTLPGILSIAPPLIAIGLAILFREVLISLFAGVWIGALFLSGFNPFKGFLLTISDYIVPALADRDHVAVVLFSMSLGGMVGILSRNGGMFGVVDKISKYAKTARSGQIATLGMGLLIFFDDYSNTLLVGNTMRPFTDKLRISREKLSFIVDATAAPIASVAFVSTWIGFQNGLIGEGFRNIGLDRDPYITFLQSIPYSFYAILMLALILITAIRKKDFGPMLSAEKRAASTGKVLRDGGTPLAGADLSELEIPENIPRKWHNALIPIGFVIFTVIIGLYFNGKSQLGDSAGNLEIYQIIGAADSFTVLMWAAFGGSLLAGVMSMGQKILTLQETVDAYLNGIKSMVLAMVILVLAWSLGAIAADLSTADYVLYLTRGLFSPHFLPAMTFIVAALIAFSTGTSWGTMAILIPIVIPMAYHLPIEAGYESAMLESIFLGTIASVLSGACFGDPCSPISDTTIMSSMASGADHIDHVKTQLPYAVLVTTVAVVVGYIPECFNINPLFSIAAGVGVIYMFHRYMAKSVDLKEDNVEEPEKVTA